MNETVCRCGGLMPPGALFCPWCGKSSTAKEKARSGPKKRGNGQGSVYKRGSVYVAEKTLGYYLDADGVRKRRSVKKSFARKKDAVEALPTLGQQVQRKAPKSTVTFRGVYDAWLPTHQAGKSTLDCYKAAWKYFAPLHDLYAHEIDIDDLQECMDDCPHGKRTRQNMKAVAGLIYKYGVPRGYFPDKLNLAEYLIVSGESGDGGHPMPDEYLEKIKKAVGKIDGADLVTAQCYLGFRPAEFLALTPASYDRQRHLFIGGAKTEAGKNRTVTVAPVIQSIVDSYDGKNQQQFFCAPDGSTLDAKAYRELFYSVLDALGLDNPITEIGGMKRHTYTPHSCRHNFANLMKRTSGSDKDKQSLIGHSSAEMLRYYQDAPVDDLRKITDQFV